MFGTNGVTKNEESKIFLTDAPESPSPSGDNSISLYTVSNTNHQPVKTMADPELEAGGLQRTLKDLFAGAAGGVAQVLLG